MPLEHLEDLSAEDCPRMTYLDYIVQFQRLRRQQPFSSTSADLYYHLLWIANGLGWKNPFNEGSSILMASLGMSDKTLTSARDKLISAGLVKYQAGKKGTFSTYELLAVPQNNTENFRSIRGESGSNKGEKAGAIVRLSGGALGGLHKSKIKNKTTKAAPAVDAENSNTEDVPKSEHTEPWATWLAENTPTVQRLKAPLTAKQWTRLVADFGEPVVHQVLLAMENKADLLKRYSSANLTARDWCERRAPAPATTLPTPVEPIVPVEPELNPAVTAERQAQRDAEAAEHRRQFRAAHAEPASS